MGWFGVMIHTNNRLFWAPLLLLIFGLGTGCLTGCADDEASARRAAGDRFNRVVTMLSQAEQGFVPEGGETEDQITVNGQSVTEKKADLQAYRQEILAEASKELEAILDMGSASQQGATRRMLADLYASQVRYEVRRAMVVWAELADQEATFMSHLGSVSRADSRMRLSDTDETPLLNQLQKDHRLTGQRIEGLQKQTSGLRSRIAELNNRVDKLNAVSARATQRTQRLHAQALQATERSKQYDLYDQSAQETRRANKAAAKAQELGVTLEVLRSELSVVGTSTRLAQEATRVLDKQIIGTKQRQTKPLYQKAKKTKAKEVEQLLSQFNLIIKEYDQGVDAKLSQAANKMSDAIDLLTVMAKQSSDRKHLIQFEQLAHMVTMTHVLTEQILAAGSHGHTLAIVGGHARRLMPSQAPLLTHAAEQVYKKQQKLIEKAKRMISEASTVLGEVNSGAAGDDAISQITKQQSKRLETYRQRINSLRLVSPQG